MSCIIVHFIIKRQRLVAKSFCIGTNQTYVLSSGQSPCFAGLASHIFRCIDHKTFFSLVVAYLHSKILDARPQSNFLHFLAVFGKIWPNNSLAPPLLGLAPPCKTLYPPLIGNHVRYFIVLFQFIFYQRHNYLS